MEYLNQQRVNKAKSLLIRNDISMKEIVEQSGFRNYNYFFKVFKEMVGMTPSAFAAKNRVFSKKMLSFLPRDFSIIESWR